MVRVAFGKQEVERMKVFEWFAQFENGATSTEDAKCLGYSMTSKKICETRKELVLQNRMTVREVGSMRTV